MANRQVGIIDVGSNSIKLLIAQSTPAGNVRKVQFLVENVRIGEGMTHSPPLLTENAIAAGSDAIARLQSDAEKHRLDALRIVATSAVRDAQNQADFASRVEARTGLPLDILPGDEEARLIGKGIRQDPALGELNDFVAVDLGGGSMECIQFVDQTLSTAHSFNLGSVRLSSMLLDDRSIPVSSADEERIANHVLNTLQQSPLAPNPQIQTAVLTGGASQILAGFSAEESIERATLDRYRQQICSRDSQKRVTELGIPESRSDIFPAAAITLCETLAYLRCDRIHFSQYNLRYGLAAELMES